MRKPHTDIHAYPQPSSQASTVGNCRLINVNKANVRNSTVSGTFLLYEKHHSAPYLFRNKTVIDVDCEWYEWRPDRGCIRLILRNGELPYTSTAPRIPYYTNIER
jgi:hypothetical protein